MQFPTLPLIARHNVYGEAKVAAAHADGSTTVFNLKDSSIELLHEWKETRLRAGQKYVGLDIFQQYVVMCSNSREVRSVLESEGSTLAPRTVPSDGQSMSKRTSL